MSHVDEVVGGSFDYAVFFVCQSTLLSNLSVQENIGTSFKSRR